MGRTIKHNNKNTIPAKRNTKLSTIPVSLDECEILGAHKKNTPVFKDDVVFHDEVLKVVVRINDFGVKEILDYDSYIEALNTEKQLNDELDTFLNDTCPKKRYKKKQ